MFQAKSTSNVKAPLGLIRTDVTIESYTIMFTPYQYILQAYLLKNYYGIQSKLVLLIMIKTRRIV